MRSEFMVHCQLRVDVGVFMMNARDWTEVSLLEGVSTEKGEESNTNTIWYLGMRLSKGGIHGSQERYY